MAFSPNPQLSDCWLFICKPNPNSPSPPIFSKFIVMFEHGGYASIWPLKNNYRLKNDDKAEEIIEQCYTPNDILKMFRLEEGYTESQPLGRWEAITSAASCVYALICKKNNSVTTWGNEHPSQNESRRSKGVIQAGGWKERNTERELYDENIQRAEDTKLNNINVFALGEIKKTRK